MKTFIQFNICAKDYYNQQGKCFIVTNLDENISLPKKCLKYIKVDDCLTSAKLGLTINQFHYLEGLIGAMFGAFFFFLITLTFIYSGRK